MLFYTQCGYREIKVDKSKTVLHSYFTYYFNETVYFICKTKDKIRIHNTIEPTGGIQSPYPSICHFNPGYRVRFVTFSQVLAF